MPFENTKQQKRSPMSPPTPKEIAEHNRALTRLLDQRAGSDRTTADDLVLFLDSRGIRQSDYGRIDQALGKQPCESASNSVCLGGHHERLAITHQGSATHIQVDDQMIAVIEQSEAEKLMGSASRPNSFSVLRAN